MYIHWETGDEGWHKLAEVSCFQGSGVYVIWNEARHANLTMQILYVGSGQVGSRLISHQLDTRFNGSYVTWAELNSRWIREVETYLHMKLNPIHSKRSPDLTPVPVNLPW